MGTSAGGARAAAESVRSAARTPSILQAALSVLVDVGYDNLTMDAVAAKAKAGKATLYRRWRDKAELVGEAITQLKASTVPPPRDTGSLRTDLAAVAVLITHRRSREEQCVMQGLVAAMPRDPALAALFQRTFLDRRIGDMAELFRRAQRRGEIPAGRDVQFLAQILPTMVFARTLTTCRPVDPAWLDQLIDDVLLPAACHGAADDASDIAGTPADVTDLKGNHARLT